MFAVLLVALFSALFFWNFVWKRRGLPPGPTPLPIVGNTHTLARSSSAYTPYQQWANEYGPVYTFWLGEAPIVVVSDHELMRDLFVKDGDAYAGRHFLNELFTAFSVSKGIHGVVRTQGENWKVIRRFGLQSMRNLGMGRARLENGFLEDIGRMIGDLRKEIQVNGTKQFRLDLLIDRLIGSTINQVVFGNAFSDEQLAEFHELKHSMDTQTKLLATLSGRCLIGMPWIRHFPPFASTFAEMEGCLCKIFGYIDKQIEARMVKREQGHGKGEEPMDMLDTFLDQMETAKGKQEDTEMRYFNMDNLRALCFDLFLAGQETTASTLHFLVLYMLLDQRVQGKMQAELEQLEAEKARSGSARPEVVTAADRAKLPYVNAVINESQRMCNLLPLNLTHKTMCDVEILGKFRLREGTIIVPQISCVLYNEKIFSQPLLFLPERFIDENGQLKRCDELIPFGLGKRICMGESLARMELFLFTANFFKQFRVLPMDPLNPPSAEKQKAFGVRPKPFECHIEFFKGRAESIED